MTSEALTPEQASEILNNWSTASSKVGGVVRSGGGVLNVWFEKLLFRSVSETRFVLEGSVGELKRIDVSFAKVEKISWHGASRSGLREVHRSGVLTFSFSDGSEIDLHEKSDEKMFTV